MAEKRKKNFKVLQQKEEQKRRDEAKKAKRNNIIFLCVAAVLILALAFGIVFGVIAIIDSYKAKDYCEYTNTREIDAKKVAYADIKVKNYGTIRILLDKQAAPETVNHFLKLVKDGFYNGLTFYKAMEDYKLEGGCPDFDGTGYYKDENGSKVTVSGEFASNGNAGKNPIKHIRGVISMANNSASSFFICTSDSDTVKNLDGKYASFGYVISGLHIVDDIMEDMENYADYKGIVSDKEKQPIIESITIVRNTVTPGSDNETEPDVFG